MEERGDSRSKEEEGCSRYWVSSKPHELTTIIDCPRRFLTRYRCAGDDVVIDEHRDSLGRPPKSSEMAFESRNRFSSGFFRSIAPELPAAAEALGEIVRAAPSAEPPAEARGETPGEGPGGTSVEEAEPGERDLLRRRKKETLTESEEMVT